MVRRQGRCLEDNTVILKHKAFDEELKTRGSSFRLLDWYGPSTALQALWAANGQGAGSRGEAQALAEQSVTGGEAEGGEG